MNIYLIGILCIVGLIISQGSTANGSPLDDRFNDVNTINKKQFTEEEFSRLINSMLKEYIEDNKKDKHPTQKTTPKPTTPKQINDGTSDKTSDTHTIKRTTPKPTTPKQINDGTSDKPKSIADIFLINKPKVPLWIVNPLYYMVEKFVQIMGYLLEDDDTLELNLPKYYYDKSI
uniref:Developmentally regulated antigen 10.3 n=1 Tax=Schistosoma mansoni TaxID=6183 RepID=A0A5K4F627_SCHMA